MFVEIPSYGSRNVSNAPHPNAVGTIVLKIMQAQRGPPHAANKLQILPATLSPDWTGTTGGDCATFSKQEVKCDTQSPYTWSAKPIDPNYHNSHVKFIFKYRTLRYLIDRGIAPPDAQPFLVDHEKTNPTGAKLGAFAVSMQKPLHNGTDPKASLYPDFPIPAVPTLNYAVPMGAQHNTLNQPKLGGRDKGKGRSVSGASAADKKEPKPRKPAMKKEAKVEFEYTGPEASTELAIAMERKYFPDGIPPRTPKPKRQPSQSHPAQNRHASQPQPSQSQGSPPNQVEMMGYSTPQAQMNHYFIPTGPYATPTSNNGHGIGMGRPPLAGRAVSSSHVQPQSASYSGSRIASNSSVHSTRSLASYASSDDHDFEMDPSPSLKRTRTMPIPTSLPPAPRPGVYSNSGVPMSLHNFGARTLSSTSSASIMSVPGGSQSQWTSFTDFQRMDES